MTASERPVIVDVFAAAGLAAHESRVLPDALDELSVRLDLKGAGPLLDEWCGARTRLARRRSRWLRTWRRRHEAH